MNKKDVITINLSLKALIILTALFFIVAWLIIKFVDYPPMTIIALPLVFFGIIFFFALIGVLIINVIMWMAERFR